jgi:hypothetical protein
VPEFLNNASPYEFAVPPIISLFTAVAPHSDIFMKYSLLLVRYTRVCSKVSGLAAWSEYSKW